MNSRHLRRYALALLGVGVLSTLVGIATGVTLQCEVAGCPPSAGSGFQGIGVEGLAVVYYSGCNACTISYWVVAGVCLLLIGTAMLGGGWMLRRRSLSSNGSGSQN